MDAAPNTNKVLRAGMYVMGNRSHARKLVSEPPKCFKCQKVWVRLEHVASKCPNKLMVCTLCGEAHHANVCPLATKAWQETLTVLIRKEGKADYGKTKAYRPVTLLPAMAKILSLVITELVAYMAKKFNMFPTNSFDGRAARSCADLLMLNVDWIYQKWREGKVVAGLFLDISGVLAAICYQWRHHQLS